MNVFLSWSGLKSRAMAAALYEWLPLVLQPVQPWFSDEDIGKGSAWLGEINKGLESSFGILCLTPENLTAPWLIYEAGALSKALDSSRVCPLLLGLKKSDVTGPLAQFQATVVEKEDFQKLVSSINDHLPIPLTGERLVTTFDAFWPRLASAVSKIPDSETAVTPTRQSESLLEEILERIRRIEQTQIAFGGHREFESRENYVAAEKSMLIEILKRYTDRSDANHEYIHAYASKELAKHGGNVSPGYRNTLRNIAEKIGIERISTTDTTEFEQVIRDVDKLISEVALTPTKITHGLNAGP